MREESRTPTRRPLLLVPETPSPSPLRDAARGPQLGAYFCAVPESPIASPSGLACARSRLGAGIGETPHRPSRRAGVPASPPGENKENAWVLPSECERADRCASGMAADAGAPGLEWRWETSGLALAPLEEVSADSTSAEAKAWGRATTAWSLLEATTPPIAPTADLWGSERGDMCSDRGSDLGGRGSDWGSERRQRRPPSPTELRARRHLLEAAEEDVQQIQHEAFPPLV